MERLLSVDIARSLCMIWIVAFWHLGPRLGLAIQESICCETITYIALAAFTFYSGLFLGKKNVSAVDFYKKRLMRFYPMFVVVCILMFVGPGGIKSFAHLMYAMTGLSVFVPPHTPILWYMDMLIVFYAITPIIIRKRSALPILGRSGGGKIILHSVLVYTSFYVLSNYLRIEGILQYFPFYVAGLIMPIDCIKNLSFGWKNFIALLAVTMIILLLVIKGGLERDLYIREVLNVCGVFMLVMASDVIEKMSGKRVKLFFSWMSYASLVAYFIHGMCFGVFNVFYAKDGEYIPFYMAPLMLTVVFILAYYIQRVYDTFLNKFLKSR